MKNKIKFMTWLLHGSKELNLNTIFRFYGYIGYMDEYFDTKYCDVKINKIFENIKKILKNYIKSKNRYFKVIYNIYIYITCHIW